MRPRSMDVLRIFPDNAIQMLFPRDQDVIETFPSHVAQEPFTDVIRPGRTI